MCLLRMNIPNLCPNMNHFDAVDFSECHSEEVIIKFLLMLGVHQRVCIHFLFICYLIHIKIESFK